MTKYSPVQVLLHWISAIVIIWAMTSGFYIFLGNTSEHVKEFVGFINVSVTTLFIPFFALRIYYAIKSGKPANIKRKPGNHALANAVHIIIYINAALVLFTGVMMMERDINIFNLVQLPHPLQGGALTSAFSSAAYYLLRDAVYTDCHACTGCFFSPPCRQPYPEENELVAYSLAPS